MFNIYLSSFSKKIKYLPLFQSIKSLLIFWNQFDIFDNIIINIIKYLKSAISYKFYYFAKFLIFLLLAPSRTSCNLSVCWTLKYFIFLFTLLNKYTLYRLQELYMKLLGLVFRVCTNLLRSSQPTPWLRIVSWSLPIGIAGKQVVSLQIWSLIMVHKSFLYFLGWRKLQLRSVAHEKGWPTLDAPHFCIHHLKWSAKESYPHR